MCLGLIFAGGFAFGNLLTNPGFEDGPTGQLPGVSIPGWVAWGGNGRLHDVASRTIDDQAFKIWWNDTGVYQDVTVTPGTDYTFSVNMFSISSDALSGWNGLIKAEFYDGVNMDLASALAVLEVGRFDPTSDAVDVWKNVSSTFTAPPGAVVGRIVLMFAGDTGSGALNYDDASVVQANPSPDFNDDGIVNLLDLAGLITAMQQYSSDYDLNGSGTVDIADIMLFATDWLYEIPDLPGYELVWSDEFDGTTIDYSNWTHQIMPGADSGNNELQYYTNSSNNSWVANGNLVIRAIEENYYNHAYTSARLTSAGKRSFQYGRMEARIKLPTGEGMWPAFWMMPENWDTWGWASCGEIDIMEAVDVPLATHGTIHFGGNWPNNTSSGGSYSQSIGGSPVDFSQDFHVYALEWEPNQMRWYVDGNLYSIKTSWWTSAGAYPAPFNKPFHFILNIAVGGNWPGPPDASTVFPQKMKVDYVRVYQLVP